MNQKFRRQFRAVCPARAAFSLLLCLTGCAIFAQAQAWNLTGFLNIARSSHTATPLTNGKVLVVGGINVINPCCTTTIIAELYDPATGRWSETGLPSSARANHIAVRLQNGKVLIAGGNGNPFNTILNTAEIYDPVTGRWSSAGSLNVARQSPKAALLADGRVLVSGGLVVNGNTASYTNTAEVYDPATNTWTLTNPMNVARVLHTLTLLQGGRVLAAGGSSANVQPILQNTAEVYDPATNRWMATGELITSRVTHTAALLANGRVLISGGSSDGTTILTSSELYDPATRQWTATGTMTTPRVTHTLTRLPNGKVLAAGGSGASSALNSAELYDPAVGMWTATAGFTSPRQNHTATLLPSGQVLIAGGSGTMQLISAELYTTGNATATSVSAASYSVATSGKEIVAAFGPSLATGTVSASTIPLPTSLAGTTVKVRDSADTERTAPLFFISANQVNYQIPDGTATGQATVTITSGTGATAFGFVEVVPTAPAIFTLNQSGTGAAVAQDAFTFAGPPYAATQGNGQPNILAVYATGLGPDATDVDGNVSASVTATIDGNPATIAYAGRAPSLVGVNQFNLVLPAGLSSGTHTLGVARNGVAGNPVTIAIR